jgi:hypothetical protein
MSDEPTLFDLPRSGTPAAPAERVEQAHPVARVERGRARETWRRTVTVDIEVVRADTVRRTALRALKRWPPADLQLAADAPDPRAEIGASSRAALQWLIDPIHGLEELLGLGAVKLVAAEVSVEELSERSSRATWFTTIKLADVAAVRRFAAARNERAAVAPAPPFPETWNAAVDAYAPVRGLSGITWNSRALHCEVLRAKK